MRFRIWIHVINTGAHAGSQYDKCFVLISLFSPSNISFCFLVMDLVLRFLSIRFSHRGKKHENIALSLIPVIIEKPELVQSTAATRLRHWLRTSGWTRARISSRMISFVWPSFHQTSQWLKPLQRIFPRQISRCQDASFPGVPGTCQETTRNEDEPSYWLTKKHNLLCVY